jgi:small subunit ribosomal protein S11
MSAVKKVSKKETKIKKIKKIPEGRGTISGHFSFNNSILSLTKENGEVLTQVSAGTVGYKNTKKATPYASQKAAEEIIRRASEYGIHTVKIQARGIGAGRDAVMKKILEASSLSVEELIDKTPIPHGGCRSPKRPRK